MVSVPPQPENLGHLKLRAFWRNPAAISAAAAVVVALTGVIALIIGQSVGHDPVGPGRTGSSFEAGTTTSRATAPEDAITIWARKVTAECNAIEPRLTATAQSIASLGEASGNLSPEQVQHATDLLNQLGNDLDTLSSSVSRITPPASIAGEVTKAVTKLDSAAQGYSNVATAIRNAVDTANTQGMDAQEAETLKREMQALAQQAISNLTEGMRALGVLGATSCSDLL